jgi:hypothetical protein
MGDAALSSLDVVSPESICRQAERELDQPGLSDTRSPQ